MSLVDEWEKDRYTGDDDDDNVRPAFHASVVPTHEEAAESREPLLEPVQVFEWQSSVRELGTVVSLAVGRDLVVWATERGSVIRYDLKNNRDDRVSIPIKQDDKLRKVFLDPTGNHILIGCASGQNFYLHRSAPKSRVLSKTKGVVIQSVGWDRYTASEKTTGNVLVGSDRGAIYEAMFPASPDEKDRWILVYDLRERIHEKPEEPISGIQVERFPRADMAHPKFFVMVATPSRHLQFIGGPTFESMFQRYQHNPPYVELPGELNYSELQFFSRGEGRAESCGWLTGAGVYYGTLVFGSQEQAGDRVVEDGKLLSYPDGVPPLSLALTEYHFVLLYPDHLTALHRLSGEVDFRREYPRDKYGTLRGLQRDSGSDTLWMFSDERAFELLVTDDDRDAWRHYLELGDYERAADKAKTDEQRARVLDAQAAHYFQMGSYERAAKAYAQSQYSFEEITLKFVNNGQRDALQIYLTEKLGTLSEADKIQRVMICTWLTEIYLDQLSSLRDAAQTARRAAAGLGVGGNGPPLVGGPSGGRAGAAGGGGGGASVVGTAAHAAANAEAQESEARYEAVVDEFRSFLSSRKGILNRSTTYELMSSHGRTEDLLFFAELIGDLEWVMQYHVQKRQWSEALGVLAAQRDPHKVADLFYRYCPTLMQHIPAETVDLIKDIKVLDPSKLLPALMRYESHRVGSAHRRPGARTTAAAGKRTSVRKPAAAGGAVTHGDGGGDEEDDDEDDDDDDEEEEEDDDPNGSGDDGSARGGAQRGGGAAGGPDDENHAIRYLEVVVASGNTDPAIHNYLVSLYAKLRSERPLLRFITEQDLQRHGKPIYDFKYALRLAHQEQKRQSCVKIYEVLGQTEEAVRQALLIDVELAKQVVVQAECADAERKRLWLIVARHVIERDRDVKRAMSVLADCKELKVEDLLPYFPDFVRIGEFRDQICSSLEGYNHEIDHLKNTMDGYTQSARQIRVDIAALRNRSGFVTANQKCDVCLQPVLTREFLLFPCTHVFHQDCCRREWASYFRRNPRVKADAKEGEWPPEDEIPASECLLCGRVMIDQVREPFVRLPEEEKEAASWAIDM